MKLSLPSENSPAPPIPDRYRDSDDPNLRYKNIVSGDYPLSRPLFIYVDIGPEEAPERAFLEFILSEQGQQVVQSIGYVPLSDDVLVKERFKLTGRTPPLWMRVFNARWWPF